MAQSGVKYVRVESPTGGIVLNWMGMGQDTHYAYPLTIDAIKRLIARGARCYERLEEADENGKWEVLLTLENLEEDNGGLPVPDEVNIIQDEEGIVAAKHEEEWYDYLIMRGSEIKEKQEKIAENYFLMYPLEGSTISSGSTSSSISGSTISSGSTSSSISGSTDSSITGSN